MDRVKLGRALGYGTRHAAKTLAAVAEAAATPSPRQGSAPPSATQTPQTAFGPASAAPRRPAISAQARAAGRSVWAPLATFSSALWLRLTGTFFAIIALSMASGAWRQRTAVHAGNANPTALRHFELFAGLAVLFTYFAVTSFMRATLRERRAASPTAR